MVVFLVRGFRRPSLVLGFRFWDLICLLAANARQLARPAKSDSKHEALIRPWPPAYPSRSRPWEPLAGFFRFARDPPLLSDTCRLSHFGRYRRIVQVL